MLTADGVGNHAGDGPEVSPTKSLPCLSTVAVGVFRREGSPVLTPRDETRRGDGRAARPSTEQRRNSERRVPAHPIALPQFAGARTGDARNASEIE